MDWLAWVPPSWRATFSGCSVWKVVLTRTHFTGAQEKLNMLPHHLPRLLMQPVPSVSTPENGNPGTAICNNSWCESSRNAETPHGFGLTRWSPGAVWQQWNLEGILDAGRVSWIAGKSGENSRNWLCAFKQVRKSVVSQSFSYTGICFRTLKYRDTNPIYFGGTCN